MKCADCEGPSRDMTPKALAQGSSVRDPGEPICEGCSSRRILMVRAVDRLPTDISQIRAMRVGAIKKFPKNRLVG